MNKEFFDIELPKWPGLLVLGDKVTKEQAMEILIRTDSLSIIGNDREFQRFLNKVVYDLDECPDSFRRFDLIRAKIGTDDFNSCIRYEEEKKELVGKIFSLYYLENHRILSSWVGGPYGWCDWDGNIKACNYNIGKWPSVESVYNEWKIIAKELPFLNLKSQILDWEIHDENHEHKPLVEFEVKNGEVTIKHPLDLLLPIEKLDFVNLLSNSRERGCTISQFAEAYQYNLTKTLERDNNK